MNRITGNANCSQTPGPSAAERYQELLDRLDRIERLLDEFAGAYLNAKFPHGKPVDRWRRRGAA